MKAILLLALIANWIDLASPLSALADGAPPLLVRVNRWQGPSDTMVYLQSSGSLLRLDGGLLIVSQQGSISIAPDEARAIIERAESLPELQPTLDGVAEGDRFLVVTPTGRVSSAHETTAGPELRRVVDDVLNLAKRVESVRNTGYFLLVQPVEPRRIASLRAAEAKATDLGSLDSGTRTFIDRGVQAQLLHVAIGQPMYAKLLAALGGRDAFVRAESESWFQIELWSPPE